MTRSLGPIPVPASGQRQSGYFTFEADPELARHRWPYFSVAGNRPGPTCLVTAGIHACEYTGIEAATRLGRTLDPAAVEGLVVILPLLNVPGFYERSIYVNPEDGRNLNRAFPGSPEGSWSGRFAHRLLHEVIERCGLVIDLHAGDLVEDLVPFTSYQETGDSSRDRTMARMAAAYGADWVVTGPPTGEPAALLHLVAAERGIPAIIAESGRLGQLEEAAVARHVAGVQNVLRTVGVLRGEPASLPPPRVVRRFEWLRSPCQGVCHPRVRVGDRVDAGSVVAEVVDLLGAPLAELAAPCRGVVLFLVTSPATKQHGVLMGLGVLD